MESLVNGHCQECEAYYLDWIKHEYKYITANEISRTSNISNHHCTRKQSVGAGKHIAIVLIPCSNRYYMSLVQTFIVLIVTTIQTATMIIVESVEAQGEIAMLNML